ncbi:O-succinylbenzoic acid--CoA ligase [Microlunatus endophyticus]|uniref:O-succinylbenzoic acid--CoA ligase n=1 Tax=Microlunatus endophyticus TaxID=1716077 RepID=A0A917W570_9ACTN|nr:AMP-binding protein [Microlunatus endophyticus]GGL63886.1 O-succinylbenzoic acid--CoA ligase [Microlunatus endophyticus]
MSGSAEQLRVLDADADLGTVADAVADALTAGRPIAPLPADPTAAEQVMAMLQPQLPVTEDDAAVVVSTSGSTGVPKGVVLSRTAIRASASATEERLGGPGRWLLALPTHYVAGFMVVARAVAAGRPVHQVGRDLSGLSRSVEAGDGRSYLSVVGTQLTRALRDPVLSAALARVDVVLLGGGPADPALLERSRQAGITVVTTYGMSETCGGCVYDGVPLPGATVTLQPAEGSQNPSSVRGVVEPETPGPREGRVLLGGPMVFSGYRLNPELTAATLLDGRVRTNDRGVLADGMLQVLGRFDDVIISGGLKIDTAAVEQVARRWPGLDGEIAVVGVPDPEWGTRPVAYAESWAGQLDTEALRGYLATRLARHELPDVVVLATLPRTSSGKIDREALRRGGLEPATHRTDQGISDSSAERGGA